MKNKTTITTWLFNPFTYIAGAKALVLGLMVIALLSVLGYLGNTHFDGVLDIHLGDATGTGSYLIHAFYQLSTWVLLTAVFYITARIVSRSETRLIDIAGTMALSQAPLIIAALLGFIPSIHFSMGDLSQVTVADMMNVLAENAVPLAVGAIVFMVFTIWSVVLKYKAYSVSANIKGAKAWMSFAVGLLVCEVLSKILLYFVSPVLF